MKKAEDTTEAALRRLRLQLWLSWAGLFVERFARAFWAPLSALLAVLSALMFGLHEWLGPEMLRPAGGAVLLLLPALAVPGVRRFRLPCRAEALARLDAALPGQPVGALLDRQAIGREDPASRALWEAHVARMARLAARARAPRPALQLARHDTWALRHVALTGFVMALLFGSAERLAEVPEALGGGSVAGVAFGPAWEGWVRPPPHTSLPTLYLPEVAAGSLELPRGSRVILRFYGAEGAVVLSETVSARPAGAAGEPGDGAGDDRAPEQREFEIMRSGRLQIDGPGGRSWQIVAIADRAPEISVAGPIERSADGEMRLPFSARDDYGVRAGRAEIVLDQSALQRRHGLRPPPESRPPILLELPMPLTGDRREFTETLVEGLQRHPWAGLPVTVTLYAEDALGQRGSSEPLAAVLPGRRFFDPLAAAIVEQRRDLLWNRTNGPRVARILRAISHRPQGLFDSASAYLKLRVAIRRLEAGMRGGTLDAARRDEVARALWDIALDIEEGDLADARARLREAQERLRQAMRDGANDEEIARLMDELREAMREYMEQLAQEQRGRQDELADGGDGMQIITDEQLRQLMDRLQELMEQGRMREAQDLLEQLNEMMENMRVTEGSGGRESGQQALEGFAETLREQQGLSDETFYDLQRRFGDDGARSDGGQGEDGQGEDGRRGVRGPGDAGRSPGPGEGEGVPPAEREGDMGAPTGPGAPEGGGAAPGLRDDGGAPGGEAARGLAERQRELRRRLEEQARELPGGGAAGQNRAGEAFGRAEEAMEGAEQALREGDLPGALDRQAEALEALREGIRSLADQLAGQPPGQAGRQGQAAGRATGNALRDPLGRNAGAAGRIGTDEQLLRGEEIRRRARELLEEIRRRSADPSRPKIELDYLRRLLERF